MIAEITSEQTTGTGTTGFRKDDEIVNPRAAVVKKWLKKIDSAEKKWNTKFDEMRKNMEFVAGWQWDGQDKLDDPRYKNNVTLRMVNQKVASLYARNPQVEVTRQDRMNYQVWDGNMMSIMQALQEVQMASGMGMMPPFESMVLLQDYEEGRKREKYVDRVCETLSKVYQKSVDTHRPEFKEQMKQLVRRVITCKVGYVKVRLCSATKYDENISTVTKESNSETRIQNAQAIMNELEAGDLDIESAEVEEAQNLLVAAGASPTTDEEPTSEYLEFDFPPATSIIPSEECRNLKEFVAATFVAQKYRVDKELVEGIFNINLSQPTLCEPDSESGSTTQDEKDSNEKKVEIYEVFDIKTKTRFFVAKGFKDYVLPPESVTPTVSGFWPIHALTFNDVESEEGTKSSPFPPSDVDLLRDPQKEWNRTRDALRDQRNANAPKYVCASGMISEEDEQNLVDAKPNSVTKLKSLPPNVEPDKFIRPLGMLPIDFSLYDVAPMEKDMLMAGGMQEANVGPAGKDVTATVGTIAEQSRMTMLSSNVDDLDGFLSRVAKAGVELILRGMTIETAQRIAGIGAVLPEEDVNEYLNEINIKIQAASSGRPNRAMGIANAQQLMPILMQAGANPAAIVEELVKRMDDTLDIDNFFPLTPASMAAPATGAVSSPQTAAPQKSGAGQRTISPPQNTGGVSVNQQQQLTAQN